MLKSFEELVELSAQLPGDLRVIDNFITPKETQMMCDLYDKLPLLDSAASDGAERKDFLMYNPVIKITQNIFLPKLKNLWPEWEVVVDGGNFTTWHNPVPPHTDNYQLQYKNKQEVEKRQEISSYAVLIPLRTDTGIGQPSTIFFNQRYHGSNQRCDREISRDVLITTGYTDQPFSKQNEYYSLLDYIPDSYLHGLSVERVIPWRPESAIIWHRSQVHCAGKFQGYNNKLHLVFLLNFKCKS